MDDDFCTRCGKHTTRRVFGALLCEPCHTAEDEAIDAYERQQASKYGYRYGWKEEQ